MDRFSKTVHFVDLLKLHTYNHIFRLHGIPQDIVTNRGSQFTTQVWRSFFQALGATVSLSYCYHPQTNGQVDRANQDLLATLQCVTSTNPLSWSSHLVWIEYADNSMTNAATDLSPFIFCLGYHNAVYFQCLSPGHRFPILCRLGGILSELAR